MEKQLYTVIIYSENLAGVLNQVTAEFTRRQMNIETLNVSSSSIEGVHRYTVSLWSEEEVIKKVVKRLEKKIDVLRASYYTEDEIFVQEVALYKISTPKLLANKHISKIIRHNNARVIEINTTYTVVELTGKTETIIKLYKEFVAEGCVLQFVKSGHIAVTRDVVEHLTEQLFDEDALRTATK
ncbi:MAG: acetolactate synthase small subunit [Bacteroidaceae bacterium]|nr:acetolactate synthase small subunit [Bacteroidaceae bacterium]MBQ3121491.1 acetolactate synthase small subunit [Bacteroidaceae bacterium]MBQ3539630.1 acetolactate synthase small subunit [Bacteroidaceae bacterium]MBQ6694109.1 acetolactate synthase small subunit [Bacteroidaceae bacterium]